MLPQYRTNAVSLLTSHEAMNAARELPLTGQEARMSRSLKWRPPICRADSEAESRKTGFEYRYSNIDITEINQNQISVLYRITEIQAKSISVLYRITET